MFIKTKKSHLFQNRRNGGKFEIRFNDTTSPASSLQHEPDSLRLHVGAPPVVEVVLQVAVADAKLELLQELCVLHQIERVENVEVRLEKNVANAQLRVLKCSQLLCATKMA